MIIGGIDGLFEICGNEFIVRVVSVVRIVVYFLGLCSCLGGNIGKWLVGFNYNWFFVGWYCGGRE